MQVESEVHGEPEDEEGRRLRHYRRSCSEIRRFAVVTLTNLTFGNASIKSFLCSPSPSPSSQSGGFVPAMVRQRERASFRGAGGEENLLKATAHLFRNLAWKADRRSKAALSESGVVVVLVKEAMEVARRKEQQQQVLFFLSVSVDIALA